jgi:hypothetical protein
MGRDFCARTAGRERELVYVAAYVCADLEQAVAALDPV